MKRSYGLWAIMGFAVTSLLGTLLHFLYDFFENAAIAAPFSSVNESTWEHMKLLFWPLFLFAAVQSFFMRERTDFWCVKARGTLLGIALIPVIFYTYNGVIGKSPDFINISIFFVAAALAFIYEYRRFSRGDVRCKRQKLPLALLCLIGAAFVIFTFKAPHLNVFRDPLTGNYGV